GELARGCSQQAEELRAWPFDRIAEIVGPDAGQRGALEALRGSALATADTLAADCPSLPSAPAPATATVGSARGEAARPPLADRLDAAGHSIELVAAALAAVQPAVRDLYAALDDEQKARLYRGLTGAEPKPVPTAGSRAGWGRGRVAQENAGA